MAPIIPIPNDIPENVRENSSTDIDSCQNVNAISDSDSLSDEEGISHEGYEPLSQDPDYFIDNQCDVEEDGNFLSDEMPGELEINMINHPSSLMQVPAAEKKASGKIVSEDIKLDEERIETIKSVMKNITLPSSNLPQWASLVPEDEWKTALLSEMMMKKHENSNCKRNLDTHISNKATLDFQTEIPR